MLEELFNDLYCLNGNAYDGSARVCADVIENENGFLVTVDLPGVKKEDIKISYESGYLMIEASRKNPENVKFQINERPLKFKKTIYFNEDVDGNNVKAKYENGVLAINLARQEKQSKAIMIE